jgi:hypothetical protein
MALIQNNTLTRRRSFAAPHTPPTPALRPSRDAAALDLMRPARRPAPTTKPAVAAALAAPAKDYGERDSSGVPVALLDPIERRPMKRATKVGVYDRAATFSNKGVTWPLWERYDAESIDEALTHQWRDHHAKLSVEPFQPISPLSRRPLQLVAGRLEREPDLQFDAETRAFLAADKQVWTTLSGPQREAVTLAQDKLGLERGEAILEALRVDPSDKDALSYLKAIVRDSESAQAARRRREEEARSATFGRLQDLFGGTRSSLLQLPRTLWPESASPDPLSPGTSALPPGPALPSRTTLDGARPGSSLFLDFDAMYLIFPLDEGDAVQRRTA